MKPEDIKHQCDREPGNPLDVRVESDQMGFTKF